MLAGISTTTDGGSGGRGFPWGISREEERVGRAAVKGRRDSLLRDWKGNSGEREGRAGMTGEEVFHIGVEGQPEVDALQEVVVITAAASGRGDLLA